MISFKGADMAAVIALIRPTKDHAPKMHTPGKASFIPMIFNEILLLHS